MTVSDSRFVDIYERHYHELYAYCRRRTTADRVDDAVADTFLTAWRKIADVPLLDEALPWLYAVAYRVLGHQWRGASRQMNLRRKLAGIGVDTAPPTDEFLLKNEESTRVMQALDRLKGTDREILRLSVWEELRHQEIATVLGINVDAVKKRFSRAKKNLAAELNRMESKRTKSPAAQKGGTS